MHIKNYRKVAAMIKRWRRHELAEARKTLREAKAALADKEHWDGSIYSWPNKTDWEGQPVRQLRDDIVRQVHWATEHPKFVKKYTAEFEKRLEAADKAKAIMEMTFSISWKRSYTWGSNPNCDLWISVGTKDCREESFYVKSGSIGGCNYDKGSAAMQVAMDRLPPEGLAALDRFVIEAGPKLWAEYAIDEHPMPHFSIHGKGMSVFSRLFPRFGMRKYSKDKAVPGYIIDDDSRGEGYDYFHVVRRDIA